MKFQDINRHPLTQNPKARFTVILLLALIARLLGIASRPIWYDEAFAILFSAKGPSAMLYGTLAPAGVGSSDIHPLGYYILLWAWMKIFGETLVAVRAFSILAGLITVILVYRIACAYFDIETAQLSMLFAALAPFQIHYAQEIRMYSLMAMWLLLATYAYQRGTGTGQARWWFVFSIASAFAQYTHNLSAFYLIVLASLPLFKKDWKNLRAVTTAGIFAILLYLPWLIQLPSQFATIQQGYWVERPDVADLFTLLIVFTTNTPLPATWIPLALLIALFTVAIGIKQTAPFLLQTRQHKGWQVFYLSFAPPLLLFLFSQWRPVYIERALLPSGAIFCIWLAWVLRNTPLSATIRNFLLSGLIIASAMGIHQHLLYRDFPYGPFQAIAVSLQERRTAQDVILHSNKLTMLPTLYFDRQLPQTFIGDPPGSGADTLAPATQEVLGIAEERDLLSAIAGAERIWYIIYTRAIEEYQARGKTTHPDLEFLLSNYRLISKEQWDGIEIYLFTKP
ncbi:MAG TPA: glycosyltransferase family 39 protein [Anaerolineales bacterium]|nr:glycosyltransferase family 39 protein [Anaerolineales bacterium]